MPSPATRHGNGPGYGPSKGPGSGPARPFNDPSPPALADNHDPEEQAYRQAQRKLKRALKEEMLQIQVAIARDATQPGMTRGTIADKVLDRIDGKPVQKTEVTGADGGPLTFQGIRRVIVDPRNPDPEGI